MKRILIKKGTKHNQFIQLESQGVFLIIKRGKDKRVTAESTKKCGSEEKADITLKEVYEEYKNQGFIDEDRNVAIHEKIVFDKANWHLNDKFPQMLSSFQTYIHTGFYIGWLINNELINEDIKKESQEAIEKFKNNEITCVEFYKNQLDGVFTSDDVNEIGLAFTKDYFDFSKGKYLEDYEQTLAINLPTLFHVKDTFDNFNAISFIISKRYANWLFTKNIIS